MNVQLNVTDYFSGVIGEDCSKHGQIIGLLMPHVLSHYFPNASHNRRGAVSASELMRLL